MDIDTGHDSDGDGTADNDEDDPWDFGAVYNLPTLRNVSTNQQGPGPVGSLAAALDGSGDLVVTWAAPTDAGDSSVSGYERRYSTDGGSTWSPDWGTIGSLTSRTFTIDSPSGAIRLEVRAVSGAAHSRGAASRIGPPAAPTGLTLTPGSARIDASWTAPTATGGSAVTGYVVEYRPGTAGNWLTANVTVTGTGATITGLTGARPTRCGWRPATSWAPAPSPTPSPARPRRRLWRRRSSPMTRCWSPRAWRSATASVCCS